ncbi:hypothetical protein [Bradyrhizobium stylosanthis]|uniref:hypothetical protein n=1 Tax=Bradyrhizobium stylosanthis TaxID=1803665 RepID=UPI000AEAA191|nr:hypothetical protein [Bradyrhizobium stylosanthis]
MAGMTAPTDGLVSFQQALLRNEVELQAGQLDRELFVHFNEPTAGVSGFTYVKLDGREVQALAVMVLTEPLHGLPCFQAGVAVPVHHRGKGLCQENR